MGWEQWQGWRGHILRKLEKGSYFSDERGMLARLAPLRVPASCRMIAARKSPRRARWVKPVVLVDAEFRGKTTDRLLCGIRRSKACVEESVIEPGLACSLTWLSASFVSVSSVFFSSASVLSSNFTA